mgnify:CR=1 FL=1
MSTVAPTSIPVGPSLSDVYRFRVEDYERLAACGGLDEDAPIELLDGVIVKKTTRNPPHSACCGLCMKALADIIPAGFLVRKEDPVRLPPLSMPEPDVAVVRGAERDFVARHPGPSDVVLIVEVADSSLDRDRGPKRDLYAQAGIPIYWVVNLVDRCVEVYSDPRDGAYAAASVMGEGGAVELVVDGAAWGRVGGAAILP